jgi:phosphopantothenoylcysteine decarboxylase/phosphopantothenate--cysteine ligase
MIDGLNILLGVTGGIAAYKALELLRLLVKEGAEVWIVMTRSATEFVRPLSFQALSCHPVRTDLFVGRQEQAVEHIALADMTQLAVVAPATANVISKMAMGIADDILTTVLLAVRSPVVVCPAMNVNMFNHPAVQQNLKILRARGVMVVEPQEGELACGWEGKGRLADLETIMEAVRNAVSHKDLVGEHILVTAGPTREHWDPVRFISNRSSGKMGYALARVALRRGAQVTLISGPTRLNVPDGARFLPVTTAQEMYDAVMKHLDKATVVLKTAAVSDYRPCRVRKNKMKKGDEKFTLALCSTPDILAEVGRQKGERLVIGFAAETKDLLVHAKEKLRQKNLDWIVVNDVSRPGIGFDADYNQVTILHREGTKQELPKMSKEDLASAILDLIVRHRMARKKGRSAQR